MEKVKKYSLKHIGKTFVTNEGYLCEIIDGGSRPGCCTVKIDDNIFEAKTARISDCGIKNPYHRSVHGVGYTGIGKYSKKNHEKIYNIWSSMMCRCYSSVNQDKAPTYVDVHVDTRWHNFQNFAEWFERFYPRNKKGYDLDKDLNSIDGKKIYSQDTCIFIPEILNKFMANKRSSNKSGKTGVSKRKGTEKYIVSILSDKKQVYIGTFNNLLDANKAYIDARTEKVNKLAAYYSFDLPSSLLRAIINKESGIS